MPEPPLSEQPEWVVWTRYTRPDKKVVRHVFGPYPSRYFARKALDKMLADHERNYGGLRGIESAVCKLLLNEEST